MIPEKIGNKENPKRDTDAPGKGQQTRSPEKIVIGEGDEERVEGEGAGRMSERKRT